jgi:hypothetical protein
MFDAQALINVHMISRLQFEKIVLFHTVSNSTSNRIQENAGNHDCYTGARKCMDTSCFTAQMSLLLGLYLQQFSFFLSEPGMYLVKHHSLQNPLFKFWGRFFSGMMLQ